MNNMLYREPTELVRRTLIESLIGVIPRYEPLQQEYDMSGKKILAVFGDRGGYNAAEPVLLRALDAGCGVAANLVATCADQYRAGKLTLDPRVQVIIDEVGGSRPVKIPATKGMDLIILGASQSEDGTDRAFLTTTMSGSIPTVGIEDMYGSSLPTIRRMNANPLKHLTVCVMDEFARSMIVREFPALNQQVIVTGGPQFDKAVEIKRPSVWEERRKTLRAALHASEDQLVFLIAGGLNGTDEILEVVEGGIARAKLSCNPIIVLRAHPRATDEDKRLTQEFLQRTEHNDWFKDVPRELAPTSDDLLPGIDYVLSGYSTTNHFGILYGMSGVVYVGTPKFQADHLAEKGTKRPPQVEAGAGWYVQQPEEMSDVITMKLDDPRRLSLIAVQQRIAQYNDGHATDRVWQAMQKLMNP